MTSMTVDQSASDLSRYVMDTVVEDPSDDGGVRPDCDRVQSGRFPRITPVYGSRRRSRPAIDGSLVAPVCPLPMRGVNLGLVGAFGPRVLHTGRPWPHGAIAVQLLSAFLLVCLVGTLRLYDDAVTLRRSGAPWQPNPWHYFVGGGMVLTTAQFVQLTVRDAAISRPVPFVVGSFVVALDRSSLVAGPVSLVVRRYRLGDS